MSEHTTFAAALAAAQGEMSNVHASAQNPHFGSSYVKLDALRDAVLPVFSRHGIAVVQRVSGAGGAVVCVSTVLLWGDVVFECGSAEVPVSGRNVAQAMGSATTYLRRYQLAAVAGVAATDDDDGNASADDGPTRPAPRRAEPGGMLRGGRREPLRLSPRPKPAPNVGDLQRELIAMWAARGIDDAAKAATIAHHFDGATIRDIWSNGEALADLLALYDNDERER